MNTFTLAYGNDIRTLAQNPRDFVELKEKTLEFFGIIPDSYKYYDEEKDLITITSEREYAEALDFSSILSIIVPLNATSGISAIPIINSESETEKSASILISQDEVSLLQHDKSVATSKAREVSVETCTQVTVKNAETGISKVDSGNDGLSLVNQKSETYKVQLVSEGSNTVAPLKKNKGLNTQNIQHVSIGPSKQDFSSQKDLTAPSDLLESLRQIIRDELSKVRSFSASGITIQHEVPCNGCNAQTIFGIRFRCSVCNFNLCETCENNVEHLHPMYKMKKINNKQKSIHGVKDKLTSLTHSGHHQEEKKAEEKLMFEMKSENRGEEKLRKDTEIDNKDPQFVKPNGKELFNRVKQMHALGFIDQNKNIEALIKNNYDVPKAIESLLIN